MFLNAYDSDVTAPIFDEKVGCELKSNLNNKIIVNLLRLVINSKSILRGKHRRRSWFASRCKTKKDKRETRDWQRASPGSKHHHRQHSESAQQYTFPISHTSGI